jgi:hypothetical protein
MDRVSQQVVFEIKNMMNRPNFKHQGLEDYWTELKTFEFEVSPDWAWVFQTIYLHACLKGYEESANWLKKLFEEQADPIQKIAYRHTYFYGKHLLKKHKGK